MSGSPFARYAISALLMSAVLTAGCSFSRSSSSSSDDEDVTIVQPAPNYPEQLLQLKEAHDKKLISDEDYKKQQQKIHKEMNK